MTTWVTVCSVAALLAVAGLFAFGVFYPRPVVNRLVRSYEDQIRRIVQMNDEALARERADCDYYRLAAQSCAAAIAHREGQVRTLMALLDGAQKG